LNNPIYFDLTELFVASSKFRYYGISRVVAEVAYELRKVAPEVQFVAFSPGHRKFFKLDPIFSPEVPPYLLVDINLPSRVRPIRARLVYHRVPEVIQPLLWLRAWLIRGLNRLRWERVGLEFKSVDLNSGVLVSMGRPKLMAEFLANIPRGQGIRFVPLLHDVMPLSSGQSSKLGAFFSNFLSDNNFVISRATKILVNSFSTKRELLRFEQTGTLSHLPYVDVVQLAHECRESLEPVQLKPPESAYLLCVGSTLGRKNLGVVLEALLLLQRRGTLRLSLVLAGTMRKRVKGALASDRYKPIAQRVISVIDPNQAELVLLYKHCSALVLPSFIEGWGLPAGEALWFGRRVICSDIPVLREVCGDRASFFSPKSPEALADLIEVISSTSADSCNTKQSSCAAEFVNRGRLRSWQMVAEDLLSKVT
jgi:glycosyltransferase involved in cell wall biosynthesis